MAIAVNGSNGKTGYRRTRPEHVAIVVEHVEHLRIVINGSPTSAGVALAEALENGAMRG
jgi:hypothetical protein